MSDDPVTSHEMIAAYRATVRPTAAAKERMARALAAAADAPVIPLRPPPPRRTSPAVWLAVAAALALVAASTYWLASARHERRDGPADLLMAPHEDAPTRGTPTPRADEAAPRPQRRDEAHTAIPASPPTAAPIEPPAAPSPATNASTSGPRRPARAQRPAPPAEPGGPSIDPVLAELGLIQQIKDALDARRPADALRLIDRHARTFARGSLVEEREALRVTALCDAGERAKGERERLAFLSAYPRSAYGERVRAACAD